MGTSEDGEESSSVPDEEDDMQSIIEQLSTVQLPQVSEITSRGALLQWTAPASTENVVLNSRDLQYYVLLSDRGKEGKYKVIFKGQSLSCRIRDLRPGQEYYVCLQVIVITYFPIKYALFILIRRNFILIKHFTLLILGSFRRTKWITVGSSRLYHATMRARPTCTSKIVS